MVAPVLVSVLALGVLSGAGAIAEPADLPPGAPCAGVVVVVDASALPDAVDASTTDTPPVGLVACAGTTSAASDGLEVLRAAGIEVEGTAQWGAAFVCRVDGRPAASDEIVLPDGTVVHEACTRTPSTQAYWSLWTAGPGGGWTYASTGVSDMELAPGDGLGLVFSVGADAPAAPSVSADDARAGTVPDGWTWRAPVDDPADPDRPQLLDTALPVVALTLVVAMVLASVVLARRRR